MPLSAGTRLGVFEILAALGKGGMGEVYRAKDTNLEREVAVKILPEEMAKRPDRMARFEKSEEDGMALPDVRRDLALGVRSYFVPLLAVTHLARLLRRGR